MFCHSCGQEIRIHSIYCSHCGAPVHTVSGNSQGWEPFANALAEGSLGLAKGFATVLVGGLASVCGLAAISALISAGYLFYHFANGLAVTVPGYLAGVFPLTSIGGITLLFSSFTTLLVTLLLGAASAILFTCLRNGYIHNRERANRI